MIYFASNWSTNWLIAQLWLCVRPTLSGFYSTIIVYNNIADKTVYSPVLRYFLRQKLSCLTDNKYTEKSITVLQSNDDSVLRESDCDINWAITDYNTVSSTPLPRQWCLVYTEWCGRKQYSPGSLVTFGYLSSQIHLSSVVVCLSVTLVHPTQLVEIFRNVSEPFCTRAIRWPPRKILRRSSQGNTSVARGVAKYSDVIHVEGNGALYGLGYN